MKIRVISDLHLEMDGWKNARPMFKPFELPVMPDEKDTILVLAGDVALLEKAYMYLPFFAKMTARFKKVLLVPGNHEYYSGNFTKSLEKATPAIKMTGVRVLDRDTEVIDNVLFIGATLWTNFNNDHNAMLRAQQQINDYHCIKYGKDYRKLHPADTRSKHYDCVNFLEAELKAAQEWNSFGTNVSYDNVVVITHHAPCHLSIAPEYVGDSLNDAYYSNLSELFEFEPDLWIHGHMHRPCDYTVMETRVVCNPRGYERHGEYTGYDPKLVITI